MDPTLKDKSYGFVVADKIQDGDKEIQLLPIKIWGIRHLNRCMHMDKVYVKMVNWVEWGNAGNKLVSQIDFDQYEKFRKYGQQQFELKKKENDKLELKDFKLEEVIENLDLVEIPEDDEKPDELENDEADDKSEEAEEEEDKKKGRKKKNKGKKKRKKKEVATEGKSSSDEKNEEDAEPDDKE